MDTVSAIERGVRRVDFDDALKLCRAPDVPVGCCCSREPIQTTYERSD